MKNIIEILKGQGIELTEEQESGFKKEFYKNYKTVNEFNDEASKRKEAEESLAQVQSTFDEFKKNYEGTDDKITELTNQLASQKAEFEKQTSLRALNELINEKGNAFNCLDVDMAKQTFDLESLLTSKEQTNDIDSLFSSLKESKPYLFKQEEPQPTGKANIIATTGVGQVDDGTAQMRAVMGLKPKGDNK